MLRAIVLGAVQGLAEYVPVSSSAHLVLVPFVLGWGVTDPVPGVPALTFDVAIHLGTLVAVVAYFWRDLWGILRGSLRALAGRGDERDRRRARLLGLLAIGSVPAAVLGVAFGDSVEETFQEPQVVALLLLVTAGLLVAADTLHARRAHHREVDSIGLTDAVVIGLFQGIALLPGISRSGSTIAAGVGRGLSREAAARFSFLLSIPAIVGAALVKVPDLSGSANLGTVALGTLAAAAVGFASIWFLLRYLRHGRLVPFAVYCVVAAAIGLVFWLQYK